MDNNYNNQNAGQQNYGTQQTYGQQNYGTQQQYRFLYNAQP